jgi:hypothetical protein
VLSRLPVAAWKWLVSVVALACGLLVAAQLSEGLAQLARDGAQGQLGMLLADRLGPQPNPEGTHWLSIAAIDPGSALFATGARTGDRVRLDHPLDRWRRYAPNELVGLTLVHDGAARHLNIAAGGIVQDNFADAFDYGCRAALAALALSFGLLIGLRRPADPASRCLAMAFLTLTTGFFYSFTYGPPDFANGAGKLLQLAVNSIIWYWCVSFVLSYQRYQPTPLRMALHRIARGWRPLALLAACTNCWFGLGHEVPLLWLLNLVTVLGGVLLTVLGLFDGWRQCRGEARERHRWLLLAFACGTVPPFLTMIPALGWALGGIRLTVMLFFAGQFAMYGMLAYAVLRHRVFSFDFAISRAVVFSAVSILLLCAFGLTEWLLGPVLHGHAVPQQRHGFIDAALAVLVSLAFNHVHARIEGGIERVLFRAWHEREHVLRNWLVEATRCTATDVLLPSAVVALARYAGGAGVGIFVLHRDHYELVASEGTLALPRLIARDDPLAVTLRSTLKPVHPDTGSACGGSELALPMCHRNDLKGLVVVGPKPQGESYRPDEVALLGFAAQQIGLDLHALRVAALEQERHRLAERTRRQAVDLAAAAGRRRLADTDLVATAARTLGAAG